MTAVALCCKELIENPNMGAAGTPLSVIDEMPMTEPSLPILNQAKSGSRPKSGFPDLNQSSLASPGAFVSRRVISTSASAPAANGPT